MDRDPEPTGFSPNLWHSPAYFWPFLIIILLILVFLIWSEYGSQDCRFDETTNLQECHNKALKIEKDDSPQEIIEKIIYSVRKNHAIVSWRRAVFFGIIASLFIFIYYYRQNLPNGFIFFMITLIIIIIIYFCLTWFGAHWFRMNDDKIENALKSLAGKLGKIEKLK